MDKSVKSKSVLQYLIGVENFESRTAHKWRVCLPFITAGRNVHGDKMLITVILDLAKDSNMRKDFHY